MTDERVGTKRQSRGELSSERTNFTDVSKLAGDIFCRMKIHKDITDFTTVSSETLET